ncbi:MAG: ABC transporter permease [Bacteroidota bacterium]
MQEKEENTTIDRQQQSPRGLLWRRLRRSRLVVWSLRVLYVLIFLAVFGDFIANEKPLFCKLNGAVQFPVFHQIGIDIGLLNQTADFIQTDWPKAKYDVSIFPPIPYSSTTIDIRNKYKGPFSEQKIRSKRYRHWLGTDRLGHDLLAGLIAGTRVAMLVGVIAMSIAVAIGILLGSLAGFFGDDRFQVSRAALWLNLLALFCAWFYAFKSRSFAIAEAGRQGHLGTELFKSILLFVVIMAFANGLVHFVGKWPWLNKKINLPLDLIIMRAIEVMNSIPSLLLLLAVVAVLPETSVFYVMVIIGLIRWPTIARFLRAELLRVRNLGYIEAGRALGFSNRRLLFRHALPNAITPVLITVAFGMASAVLLESALSFLGIGIGEDGVTWGRLLSDARQNPAAWWLAIFPGGAIFVTVTIFNLIGEGLTEAMGGE